MPKAKQKTKTIYDIIFQLNAGGSQISEYKSSDELTLIIVPLFSAFSITDYMH